MKQIFFALAILISTSALSAQNNLMDHFSNKYGQLEDAVTINFGGSLISNMFKSEDGSSSDTQLDQFELISIPFNAVNRKDIQALKNDIRKSKFEELLTVKDGSDHVFIYIQENKEAITDLMILVQNPNEKLTLINLSGHILHEDLNNIEIDGKAGDALKELPDERIK